MVRTGFTHILIPVDFTVNTEVAIRKGIEMTQPGTAISLLHILNHAELSPADENVIDVCSKMDSWKKFIEDQAPGVNVSVWLNQPARIQNMIARYAIILKADLIIVAKQKVHSFFPFLNTVSPGKLVKQCGCSVLTVKPGAIENTIRTMLVYMGAATTPGKLEALKSLCQKFKVKIYLVAFSDSTESGPVSPDFLHVYQWLRTSLHCRVEYSLLDGRNKASALLNYGRKINADILLIPGQNEMNMGIISQSLPDVLPARSKIQVLAMQ